MKIKTLWSPLSHTDSVFIINGSPLSGGESLTLCKIITYNGENKMTIKELKEKNCFT